jgi:class 3 adenylate cyclase
VTAYSLPSTDPDAGSSLLARCGRPLGIDVRAGLHTGEVERRVDDIAGIGVHIGARVSALAGPGEVLVTSTVKDLVIGSGLEFDDRGDHTLKGVPGDWHLWAAS